MLLALLNCFAQNTSRQDSAQSRLLCKDAIQTAKNNHLAHDTLTQETLRTQQMSKQLKGLPRTKQNKVHKNGNFRQAEADFFVCLLSSFY